MKVTLLKGVHEFIPTLQQSTQSEWLRHLTLLAQYRGNLGMPHVRFMGSGIRELRVRGREEIRAFFFIKNEQAFIVHAYIKKTKKTPPRELEIAQKRIQSLTNI